MHLSDDKKRALPSFFVLLAGFFFLVAYLQPHNSLPNPASFSDAFVLIGCIFLLISGFSAGFEIYFRKNEIYLFIILLGVVGVVGVNFFFEYLIALLFGLTVWKISNSKAVYLTLYSVGLMLAASLTSLVAFSSLLGFEYQVLGWMLPRRVDQRWGGFLNQSNNTGTLLLLGYLSIVFLFHKYFEQINLYARRFYYSIAIFLAIAIGLSGVLVQSRTIALNLFLIFFIVLIYRRLMSRKIFLLVNIGVASYFFGHWLIPSLFLSLETNGVDPAGFGGRGLSSNLRLEIWSDLIGALWQQPWLGYGVGGTVKAFLAIESPSVVYGTYFSHAHNIVLELLLWFGIPLGSLLILVFGRSLWRIACNVNEQTLLPSMMLMVLLVHAMLELPLHYAYFLIPMAIIWGWLSGQLPEKYQQNPVFSVPVRWFSGVALVVLVPLFYVVSVTYLHHEQSLRQAKLEMAIKGWAAPAEPPPYPVLWELQALNEFVRADNDKPYTPEQLQIFDDVLSVYPAKTMIAKGLEIFERNGVDDRRAYWQRKACQIYGADFCEERK